MAIKIKKIPKREPNGDLVNIVVESSKGKEYEFCAKTEDVLDELKFKSLMNTWNRMVMEKEAQVEFKEEDIEKILKERGRIEVKD